MLVSSYCSRHNMEQLEDGSTGYLSAFLSLNHQNHLALHTGKLERFERMCYTDISFTKCMLIAILVYPAAIIVKYFSQYLLLFTFVGY